MKFILAILVVLSYLNAQEKITIGAGAYMQTQPYKGLDGILLPSPVIFFDNSVVYARWTRIGVYFLGDKQNDSSWGFSLTAQPRPYGYKSEDSKDLIGMDDRKNSFEGGLAFGYKIHDTHLEITLLTDILDRYETWISKCEIGQDFQVGKLSVYPSVMATYQSSGFLDYYYGVKHNEVTNSRNAYKPSNGLELGIQTYINYPLTDNLSAFINLRVDRLSRETINSPIVSDDYIYSGLASLIYSFEY